MEFSLNPQLDLVKASLIVIGIVIGIVGSIAVQTMVENPQKESNNLLNFLENQTGQNLEVVNTQKAGNLYKVEVRAPNDRLQTYYTNGKMYTGNMQNISQIKAQSEAITNFATCLEESQTTMFGNATQRATRAQIQALGGAQIVAPIYRDVSDNQTLRQATQLGITRVPAFYKNGSTLEGVQSLQTLEQFTGCRYQLN